VTTSAGLTRVSILLFDEVEVLDACGPFEVFSVARRVAMRRSPDDPPPFAVTTVSAGAELTIRARGGLPIAAEHLLADAPVRAVADRGRVVASVCTGAFVLAEAGLLRGRAATTHWEDVAELRSRFADIDVREDVRYLDGGLIATSAGVSAGIDLSLHLVARFAGEELAVATARQMDYPWHRESQAGKTNT
jgi:transcriptional regulator GlxA family with amidase domain